ncbi:MAG: protein-tyrosine-phosphatase [Phaeodactylibacter sp.]|nr:protein-tyrosine-phosphatase [Phaeodactylibacter sp.]MCB9299645.1 protein-tyrosine-phosphatase [Lewinellaceae bacterium]
MSKAQLNKDLAQYVSSLPAEFKQISPARKFVLEQLAEYIFEQQRAGQPVLLTVICTHNSRRSHMGQLWALVAAAWYGIAGVESFSGGTEATAFHPNAVAALQLAGFHISRETQGENPEYSVRYSDDLPAVRVFSKRFDDAANPAKGFAAILVCSEADEACPFVPGADVRIALPFEDPKYADGSPEEQQAYDTACRLIAREVFFVMEQAGKQLEGGRISGF